MRYGRLLVGLVFCGLVLATVPAQATLKVLCHVREVTLDEDKTHILLRLDLYPVGNVPALTTDLSIAVTAISDPATSVTAIKNRIIAFALAQYSVTLVAAEIAVVGAPQ
jgi:hypothetical protein